MTPIATIAALHPRRRARAALAGFLCLAASAILAEVAEQQVYECNRDGAITFSQEPCAGQERTLDIEYDRPSRAQGEAAAAAAQGAQMQAGAIAQAAVLDREILASEERLTNLKIQRDARLAELKQQRDIGSETLDQAAWLAGMNQQIESVYQDYSDRIVAEDARLDELRAQRAALGDPAPGSR